MTEELKKVKEEASMIYESEGIPEGWKKGMTRRKQN